VDFQLSAPAATAPDVTLGSGADEVPAGASVDLGTAPIGGQVTKDFFIGNTGDADLRVYGVRFSTTGVLPTGATFPFRLVSAPAQTVQPGRTAAFRIAFQANVGGSYQGKMTLVTSDGDELFYAVNIAGTAAGTLPPPEIAFRDGATEVAKNGSVDFGSTAVGSRLLKEFTIANTGTAELRITSYSLAPAVSSQPLAFSIWSSAVPTAVAAGGQSTFKVALYNLVPGSYQAKLTLNNNDPDENPTVITFSGTVVPDPVQGEIGLSVGGANVPNGSALAYGNTFTGVAVTKDLLISNTGAATLKLTGWSLVPPPSVYLSVPATVLAGSANVIVTSASGIVPGATVVGTGIPSGTTVVSVTGTMVTLSKNATASASTSLSFQRISVLAFRFDGALPLTVAAGATATARVLYVPLAQGDHVATLTLYNNDGDENPYVLNLSGHADANPNPGDIALSLNGSDLPMEGNVDFGAVGVGSTAAKTIAVTNAGSGELRFLGTSIFAQLPTPTNTAASGPPAFLFGGLPPSVLTAGQTGTIVVNFKPTAVGTAYKSQVQVASTDPDEANYRFNVLGTGGALVPLAPQVAVSSNGANVVNGSSLALGSALTGNTVSRQFVVSNTGNVPLTLTGWSMVPPAGTTTTTGLPFRFEGMLPFSLGANASATVTVTYAPITVGDHVATLQFSNNDSDENPFKVTLTAHADLNPRASDIALTLAGADLPSNATIDFGILGRGVTVTKEIQVRNTGTAELRITGYPMQVVTPVTPPVSGTNVLPPAAFFIAGTPSSVLQPGQSGVLRVSFKPLAINTAYASVLTLTSNDPDESAFKLNLTGASAATDSEIALASAGADLPNGGSLPFGSAIVGGASVAKDIMITNSGDGELRFTSWSILPPTGTTSFPVGGPMFRFEGVLPQALAAGASATVRLVYAPFAVGDHAATVQIANTDADEGAYKINVSGHADNNPNPPDIALALSSVDLAQNALIDFGGASRGTTVSKDIQIRNTGTGELRLVSYTFQNSTPASNTLAFFITSYPPSTIAPGASATLEEAKMDFLTIE
ncbi:MAG: choice-of-anchor D domain-containing protein, partial [Roseimicrobium sp.]